MPQQRVPFPDHLEMNGVGVRQQQQPQPQPQVAQQNKLPKEQADRILDALRNSEKEIQKQLRKREGTKIRAEKDW